MRSTRPRPHPRRPSDAERARKAAGLVAGSVLLALGVAWAGCVGGGGGGKGGNGDEAGTTKAAAAADRDGGDALLPGGSWIATAAVPELAVYPQPDPDPATPPIHRLANPDENGTALVLLVDGPDAGGPWLPVLLPVRPNGSKGWVRSSDVELAQTQYRIEVELGSHRLTLRRDREAVLESPIGVGTDATPTPGGRYYVKELIQPPTPDTVYGPYVFGLSGFSNVLTSFAGDSDAVIGIHGNNDPGSIGRNVSHGCIRLPNDVVTRMTELVPLGTPVDIRP